MTATEERQVQILELFGGIGSPRCALRNLKIPTKAIDYVEIDEKAVRSYNNMFSEELPYKTQSVVGWNLKPDILIHGSPCQDFSIAGHQRGADEGSETRSSLMWETIHIIDQMGEWKPKYVIWENVKNVTSKHMIANFVRYQKEMERMGYTDEEFEAAKAVHERKGRYYMTLYKQAGNSIAVPIFESIFRKIILGEEKRKKDDSERQEGDAGR